MPDVKQDMQQLVSVYEKQRGDLRRSGSGYSEADTRADFLDPFFGLLGWDVTNKKGLSLQLREVIRETQVAVDEQTKRPDYVFRLGRERRFFVEAKTPNIDLLTDPRPAFQTRRYGWSGNLLISVVTNFENLVYNFSTIT